MSKTGWIILIVCLCLIACICLGLFLAGRIASSLLSDRNESRVDSSTTNKYKDLRNAYSADGVYSVSMNGLKELTIDWIAGSVTVELTDGDAIRFQETADRTILEQYALRYGTSGGKLRIQACKKGYVGKLPKKDLTVYLPRSLVSGLKECEFNTVSASLSAYGLSMNELEVNSVSGKLELTDMTAEEAQVDTVSGQIELPGCAFDSLRLNTVSCFVHVVGAVKKVKAQSVSGRIQLFLEECREVRVSTVSGAVAIDLSDTPKELKVDTTSADVSISLPQDADCVIHLDSVSGKLYLNETAASGKEIILGDGTADLDMNTMSGNVRVYTK